LAGIKLRNSQADRVFALASDRYQEALRFAPDDKLILDKYAKTLCDNLVFEGASPEADRWNRRKVSEAIEVFQDSENLDALAEVLRRLPAVDKFGELACDALDAILRTNKHYFTLKSAMPLRELATLPNKFSLCVPGSPPRRVHAAATIYRLVLAEPTLSSMYGEEDLNWAATVETDEVLCGLVTQAETDADNRIFDLHDYLPVQAINDHDLQTVADNRRLTLAFNLSGCKHVSDAGMHMAARFCTSLHALTLDGCVGLTDKTLLSLKRYTTSLTLLSLQQCSRITDVGLVSMMTTCTRLRVLNLNYCKMVSDETLQTLAEQCRMVELLHLAFCTNITDAGIYGFALRANHDKLKSVDLSYLRGISDDAVEALCKKCTKITHFNVCGVNRITDIGAKAITHNLWNLTSLNMEDLYLVTDAAFVFDHARDGRKAAEAQMLRSLTELNLSECSRLTDRALGSIATRCDKLKNFHASGVSNFSNEGIQLFVREPVAQEPRGENMYFLDLSFISSLTDEAVELIAKACPKVEILNLSGCILLTDHAVQILCTNANRVKILGLAFCKRLTDRAICIMADYLWLEELDLCSCSHITDDGIEVLCLEFAGMQKLDLSACAKVTDQSMDSIARHCESLVWLKICEMPQVTEIAKRMIQEKFSTLELVLSNDIDEEIGKSKHSIF